MAALSLPDRRSNGGQAAPRPITVLPRWRRRIAQLLAILAVYTLPLLALTRQPTQTDLWLQTGIAHQSVHRVVVGAGTPPTTYALLTQGGIRRSSDEGITWLAVDGDLPFERWGQIRIEALALDPLHPDLLLSGMAGRDARDPARSAGLYLSVDQGHTWQAPGRVFAGQQVQAIAICTPPHSRYICVATDAGIYCTELTDDGVRPAANVAWHRLDWRGSDARITTMAMSPANASLLFVGTDSLGLYITRDAGSTWSAVPLDNAALRVNDLMIATANADWVYVATDWGVYRSTDGGAWWELAPGLPANRPVLALAGDPRSARVLYAGLDGSGVYLTVDGGSSWRELKTGIGNARVSSLVVDPTDPRIVWAATAEGLWRYVHQADPLEAPAPGATEAASPAPIDTETPEASATARPTQTITSTLTATALPPTPTSTPAPTFTPTPSPTVPTATPAPTHTTIASPTPIPLPTETPTQIPTATDTPRPIVPTATLVPR